MQLRRETAKEKERAKRAAIPYAAGTSEALARIFKAYGIQIAHVPTRKLRQELVHAKDPLKRPKFRELSTRYRAGNVTCRTSGRAGISNGV